MDSLTRKISYEDRFARKYFCPRCMRTYRPFMKKSNRKKMRRELKKETKEMWCE